MLTHTRKNRGYIASYLHVVEVKIDDATLLLRAAKMRKKGGEKDDCSIELFFQKSKKKLLETIQSRQGGRPETIAVVLFLNQ